MNHRTAILLRRYANATSGFPTSRSHYRKIKRNWNRTPRPERCAIRLNLLLQLS